jgi:hypothetical protein
MQEPLVMIIEASQRESREACAIADFASTDTIA